MRSSTFQKPMMITQCASPDAVEFDKFNECHEGDAYEWSRSGPMGHLVDPKLYPTKCCSFSKINNSVQKKICEKRPYEVCRIVPRPSKQRISNLTSFKTIYQLDYCPSDKHLSLDSDEVFKVVDRKCGPQEMWIKIEREPKTRPRLPYPKKQTRPAWEKEEKTLTEKYRKSAKEEEENGQSIRLPPWKSEYQDIISRTGQAIIKDKIHHYRCRKGVKVSTPKIS